MLQKGYWCEKFDKPLDLFDDSLKDLIYDKVGRSTEKLQAIEEYAYILLNTNSMSNLSCQVHTPNRSI